MTIAERVWIVENQEMGKSQNACMTMECAREEVNAWVQELADGEDRVLKSEIGWDPMVQGVIRAQVKVWEKKTGQTKALIFTVRELTLTNAGMKAGDKIWTVADQKFGLSQKAFLSDESARVETDSRLQELVGSEEYMLKSELVWEPEVLGVVRAQVQLWERRTNETKPLVFTIKRRTLAK